MGITLATYLIMLLCELNEWTLVTHLEQYLILNMCLYKLDMMILFSLHINPALSSIILLFR